MKPQFYVFHENRLFKLRILGDFAEKVLLISFCRCLTLLFAFKLAFKLEDLFARPKKRKKRDFHCCRCRVFIFLFSGLKLMDKKFHIRVEKPGKVSDFEGILALIFPQLIFPSFAGLNW
jgi:hypothetical protein